jgi:hypothetical protein
LLAATASSLLTRDILAEPLPPGSGSPPQRRRSAMESLVDEAVERVLPRGGLQTRIALSDSVVKLVEHGVIDPERFLAVYRDPDDQVRMDLGELLRSHYADSSFNPNPLRDHNGAPKDGLPPELRLLLSWPSHRPILLTRENANVYVNLLWPLGLANRLAANEASPVNGESLPNLASTAGWTLGREENGAAYFNRLRVVELTAEQEDLAVRVAKNTYRPCCNNSTFFQDCNHGSALFGVLQLGASQGLSEAELYQEALAFNSFWFPSHYVQIALYLTLVENRDWAEINSVEVMSYGYSAASPSEHKLRQVTQLPGLLPLLEDAANCGA